MYILYPLNTIIINELPYNVSIVLHVTYYSVNHSQFHANFIGSGPAFCFLRKVKEIIIYDEKNSTITYIVMLSNHNIMDFHSSNFTLVLPGEMCVRVGRVCLYHIHFISYYIMRSAFLPIHSPEYNILCKHTQS